MTINANINISVPTSGKTEGAISAVSNVVSNVNNAATSAKTNISNALSNISSARDRVANVVEDTAVNAKNKALDAFINVTNMPVRGVKDLQSAIGVVGSSLGNVLPQIETEKILGLDYLKWDLERAIKNLATTVAGFAAYIAIRVAALGGTTTSLAGKESAGACILTSTGVIAGTTFTGTGAGTDLITTAPVYTPGVDIDTGTGNVLKSATAVLGGCTKAFQVASSYHSFTQIIKFIAHIAFLVFALAAMVAEFKKFFDATKEKMLKLIAAAEGGKVTASSTLGKTLEELGAIVNQLQANVNVLAAASISPTPMNVLIKSLGYSTSGLALSTIQQIVEAPVLSAVDTNVFPADITTDQLVVPGVLINIPTTQLPVDLSRKLKAAALGTSTTTAAEASGDGTLTVENMLLIIPDNAVRGVLSTDVKVCKP